MAGAATVADLLARCLRAAGAVRVVGAPADGLDGVPGLAHARIDDPAVATLVADALGRIGDGPGVALLPGRRLRLSAQPGAVVAPVTVRDPADLTAAVAGWSLDEPLGCVELVLDLDLDAPVPPGVEPLTVSPAGPAVTLGPDLAELGVAVLVGPGVVRAGQTEALRAFAEQTGLGVVNTWGAKGVFRWDDPHHHGTAGLQARDFELAGIADAPVVVAVGIDPLEAPAERWATRQVVEVAPHHLALLGVRWDTPPEPAPVPALYTELATALRPLYDDDRVPCTPARVAGELGAWLAAGAGDGRLVAADPGPAGLWVARALPTTVPGSVVVPGRACRGFAAAAGLAAALEGRPATVVTTAPAEADEVTTAVLDQARALGALVVLESWGTDVAGFDAAAHASARERARAEGGVHVLPVPVDFSLTRVLVEVAGEVVAWRDDG